MLSKLEITQKLKQKVLGKKAHALMAPMGRELDFDNKTQSQAKQSSVLIILDLQADELSCILTKRNTKLRAHPGQISLPGGSHEYNESFYQTATRESEEEIGICANQVSFIAELSPLYIPHSNYIIHPFVAWNEGAVAQIKSPDEVEKIIHFPISTFLDKTQWGKAEIMIDNKPVLVPAFVHNTDIVWGATAMILAELIELLNN